MSSVNRRAGYLQISWNGNNIEAKGSFNLTVITTKKEGLLDAAHNVTGYSEVGIVPGGKGVIQKNKKLKAKDLSLVDDATIVAICADGTRYMYSHCWYSGSGELTTENGDLNFEWQSKTVDEIAS